MVSVDVKHHVYLQIPVCLFFKFSLLFIIWYYYYDMF